MFLLLLLLRVHQPLNIIACNIVAPGVTVTNNNYVIFNNKSFIYSQSTVGAFSNDLLLCAGGGRGIHILSNASVGIGGVTPASGFSPAYTLDISGSINITGALSNPNFIAVSNVAYGIPPSGFVLSSGTTGTACNLVVQGAADMGKIGSNACFGNYNVFSTYGYALMQSSAGDTFINCALNKNIHFLAGNSFAYI